MASSQSTTHMHYFRVAGGLASLAVLCLCLYSTGRADGFGMAGSAAAAEVGAFLCDLSLYGAIACLALAAVFVVYGSALQRRQAALKNKLWGLVSPGATPREFLSARDRLTANGDFTGVYVIHNTTRNLYYVGQSVRVVGRVTQHLTGHGNGDVYADLKYGDAFEISVVSLTQSGYESLDALERDAIDAFDAYGRGYNRTRGNRN